MSKKKVLVEGFEFFIRNVAVEQDYHSWSTLRGDHGGVAGPSTIRLEAEASSIEYSKEDWGDLMNQVTGHKVTLVIEK